MWSYFFPNTDSSKDSDSSRETQKPTFTTSREVCDAVNPADPGICSPLTNAYTKYQVGTGSHDFLEGDAKKIYAAASKERAHQLDLKEHSNNPFDSLHSGFFDSDLEYQTAVHEASDLKTAKSIEKATDPGQHSIATFRVDRPDSVKKPEFHQVALGRDKSDPSRCYFFDANIRGGERVGECDHIYSMFAKTLRDQIHHSAKDVLIATDKVSAIKR